MIVTPAAFEPLLAPVPHDAALTFAFRRHEILVTEEEMRLPTSVECAALPLGEENLQPVGMLGGVYCRAAWLPQAYEPLAGFTFVGLRKLWNRVGEDVLAVAGRAYQIAEWARTHRFCGACGSPMTRAEGERAMKCAACGHSAYPRISPAMMVLVKRGPAILLARNVIAPPGRMSALAGFLEPGESIEDAIHREVEEEVGLKVRSLRYFASQSWPFPHSLMIAFTAEYASGEIRIDEKEIVEARWFGPGDPLPQLSPEQSISRALIDANLPK